MLKVKEEKGTYVSDTMINNNEYMKQWMVFLCLMAA